MLSCSIYFVFFFKQKTAYEMRISDWSSDVCSSDLSTLPDFTGVERGALAGRLLLAPSVQALESAFDAAKYGELPPQPALEIVIPSLADPSLVENAGHVMSIVVQYAPYHLKGGWTDAARRQLADSVFGRLEAFAPGLRSLILAPDVLTDRKRPRLNS